MEYKYDNDPGLEYWTALLDISDLINQDTLIELLHLHGLGRGESVKDSLSFLRLMDERAELCPGNFENLIILLKRSDISRKSYKKIVGLITTYSNKNMTSEDNSKSVSLSQESSGDDSVFDDDKDETDSPSMRMKRRTTNVCTGGHDCHHVRPVMTLCTCKVRRSARWRSDNQRESRSSFSFGVVWQRLKSWFCRRSEGDYRVLSDQEPMSIRPSQCTEAVHLGAPGLDVVALHPPSGT